MPVFCFTMLIKNIMFLLEELNSQFAIDNTLQLIRSEGELIMIDIDNEYAKATISPHGGQVLSFLPKSQAADVLYLSKGAVYQHGKAIRGGIPICWPWFGDDASGFGRPAHGFVRNMPWDVLATNEKADGSTSVKLGLNSTHETLAIWPHKFELSLDITVGEQLTLALTTKNIDNKEFTITQALHTYLNVGDIEQVSVVGMDKLIYLDKLENYAEKTQSGDITVDKETDRVYQHVPSETTLIDNTLNRTTAIASQGSHSTVVWNPWIESTAKLSDMDDDSYKNFICIETANVFDDSVTIPAGGSHTLTAVFDVKNNG
jgi:glucose-6-phosphate 1-epimerase